MSVVGPRPLLVRYLPLYSEHQARRHSLVYGKLPYNGTEIKIDY